MSVRYGVRLLNIRLHQHPLLRLAPGLIFSTEKNVLLGQNGTGKTTLLELVASVSGGTFEEFAGKPFAIEYELSFAECKVEVSLISEVASQSGHEGLEPRFAQSRERFTWRCTVKMTLGSDQEFLMEYSPRNGTVRIDDRRVDDLDPIEPFGHHPFLPFVLLNLARHVTASDASRSIMDCAFEALNVSECCYRFDEALDSFNSMVGEGARAPGFSVMEHAEEVGIYPVGANRIPAAILARVLDAVPTWKNASKEEGLPVVYAYHHELEFLEVACEAMGFKAARVEIRAVAKDPGDSVVVWKFGGCKFDFIDSNERQFTHNALSFGQKRLLTFLFYAAGKSDVLVVDELVNGLHHGWIRMALNNMGARQLFLSSQNPLLLDSLEFRSVEEVQRSFIICGREKGGMGARNLTRGEAQVFFRRIEAGIQQVSEILDEMGLW